MRLHSTLEGSADGIRLRGAAWEREDHTFHGYAYLISARADNGRYPVVEAEGADLWQLLGSLAKQASTLCGTSVKRLDARAVMPKAAARDPRRPLELVVSADAKSGNRARRLRTP